MYPKLNKKCTKSSKYVNLILTRILGYYDRQDFVFRPKYDTKY